MVEEILCFKCKHPLKVTNYSGRIIVEHQRSFSHEGDGGDYDYCAENVIDCSECKKKGRKVYCGCACPSIWLGEMGDSK